MLSIIHNLGIPEQRANLSRLCPSLISIVFTEADLEKFDNIDEFCELVSQFDPHAADDPYYETSSKFIELRANLGKELRQSLFIAVGLAVVLSSMAVAVW